MVAAGILEAASYEGQQDGPVQQMPRSGQQVWPVLQQADVFSGARQQVWLDVQQIGVPVNRLAQHVSPDAQQVVLNLVAQQNCPELQQMALSSCALVQHD